MTIKDAIEVLKDYHESQTCINEIIGELGDEFCDAIGLAIAALEKSRVTVETNIYDQEEIHHNCTVQILTNSVTGDVSVGWWKEDEE